MRRFFKFIGGMFLLLLILLLALFIVQQTVLPGWAAREITGRLEAHKIPVQRLDARGISFTGAELANLALGPEGEIRVDSLRVSYALDELREKRVGDIEAGGVVIRLPEAAALVRHALPSGEQPAAPRRLPFASLTVNGAILDCAVGGRRIRLEFSGKAVQGAELGLNLSGTVRAPFGKADIEGRIDGEDLSCRMHGLEFSLFQAAAFFGLRIPDIPVDGPVEGALSIKRSAGDRDRFDLNGEIHQTLRIPLKKAYTNRVQVAVSGFAGRSGEIELEGQAGFASNRMQVDDLSIAFDRIAFPFSFHRNDRGATATARALLEGGTLNHASGLNIGSLQAELDLPTDASMTGSGHFAFRDLAYDDLDLGSVKGKLDLRFDSIQSALSLDLLGSNTVHLVAGLTGDQPVVVVNVPEFELGDQKMLQAMIKAKSGFDSSGKVALRFRYEHGARDPAWIHVGLRDARFELEGLSAEGVNGAMDFSSMRPFRSLPHQEWKVARLVSKKAVLEKGTIRFTVEDLDRVFVEENQWAWAGGVIYSKAFTYRPSLKAIHTELYCERVDLQEVLTLIMGKQITGSGQLFGRLPIKLRWQPYGFGLVGGYLHAAPGVNRLHIQDQEVVGQVLQGAGQAISQGRKGKELKDRIILSLKNFEYNAFRIDFKEDQGGFPTGAIHIVGEGQGELGVPLIFNLRFSKKTDE